MSNRIARKREWLIRTDTQYSGDKLFVQRPEDKNIEVDSINSFGNRRAVICRKMLETICYGDTIITPTLRIDDANRKQYYELLKAMYSTERKYLDSQRSSGIAVSTKNGNYKGREGIKINTLFSEFTKEISGGRRVMSRGSLKS